MRQNSSTLSGMSPRKQISKKKKIALALSGGGTKAAAFHIGVGFALQENGFEFYSGLKSTSNSSTLRPLSIQTYIGSSAGSFIASIFGAGYSLENITGSFLKHDHAQHKVDRFFPRALPRLQYTKMFRLRPEIAKEQAFQFLKLKNLVASMMEGKFPSLLQLRWLKMTGLFSTSGLEQFVREEVLPSNRFEDYLPEIFVIGTRLNEARKVIFGKNSYSPPAHDPTCLYQTHVKISDAVAASAALPVIFAPYAIPDETGEQQYYIDGETRETLSTHVAVDSGADLVLASYSHQPYRMSQGAHSLTELGLPAIVLQTIYILIEQKINSVLESYRSKQVAMNEVYQYLIHAGLSQDHQTKIMEILEKELHQTRNLDLIRIHPEPADSKMFFAEHFSLNANKLNEIVKAGYRAGKSALSKYEFETH